MKDRVEKSCVEEIKSEESFLSEDSCSNCGLANHPELVRDECVGKRRGRGHFFRCTLTKKKCVTVKGTLITLI